MKNKSDNNMLSAQILIDNKQFTSSVHCSYYAVFQYMKYMLANTSDRPITFATQDAHSGESSHEYILTEIKNRINAKPQMIRTFTQTVRLLKNNRVDADYHHKDFSDEESITCRDLANTLITNLKTYFGNL
ncbi:MAG: HEPN domain-containing protein [Bacteroides sp.]|nr:HEPN domain-containing protein [Bacteroides sp.]